MELQDVIIRVDKLENKIDSLVTSVSKLQGSEALTKLLCKWVIFPLIVIVGACVGINVMLPV